MIYVFFINPLWFPKSIGSYHSSLFLFLKNNTVLNKTVWIGYFIDRWKWKIGWRMDTGKFCTHFGVCSTLGIHGLTHIYSIFMDYWSVLVVLLFNQCKYKLGVSGACKDIFKYFDDGSHEIFESQLLEKWYGVGGVQP